MKIASVHRIRDGETRMHGSLTRRNVLTMILAGGQGERLYPLTRDRAKPAVPFGGRYRIIDFVINNFINSGFFKIKILTQFKSNSLIEHITRTWRLVPEIGQYVDVVPAQMRKGPFWFRGTADAVFQNLELIFDEQPEYVCVFGGDHIYKMDVNQMLQEHLANDADLTIATIPVPLTEAHHFGIVEIDSDWRVMGFEEKPKEEAKTIPGRPEMVLASMGNYIFKASVMIDVLQRKLGDVQPRQPREWRHLSAQSQTLFGRFDEEPRVRDPQRPLERGLRDRPHPLRRQRLVGHAPRRRPGADPPREARRLSHHLLLG